MNILVTGANGFVARALVARLLGVYDDEPAALDLREINSVVSVDRAFNDLPVDSRHRQVQGSLSDSGLMQEVFNIDFDVIFHLASTPGGLAEQNYQLSREVNVDATNALLERSAQQDKPPVFVFSSSIAVFGSPMPSPVVDSTPFKPQLTYAAQKIMGELLVSDFHRRGCVDGRSVRFSGVVARTAATGQLSAFMSDIISRLAAGEHYECPVQEKATTWLVSRYRIIEALLHAAAVDSAKIPEGRVLTLPALHCSMGEVARAVGEAYDIDVAPLVTFTENPELEANFGRFPPLETAAADSAGFKHDGDLQTLVKMALHKCGETSE